MNRQKTLSKNSVGWLKEGVLLTIGVTIVSLAVFFFLVPSKASVSSIAGLSIVLSNFIPLPISAITMILNVLLLIIGFFTCGKAFGAKTVYTSILLPLLLALYEKLWPNNQSMTGSAELDVLAYILLVSLGLSILFNLNASSGGLDIVAKIMNKYLHMELGQAMSLSGMLISISSALVYDKKIVVLSVITKKEDELKDFILHKLHSGATIYEAIGAYSMDTHHEIITIVNKSEYQQLMRFINQLDTEAFITVYTVSDMRYRPKI